jgi:hypothetical protein
MGKCVAFGFFTGLALFSAAKASVVKVTTIRRQLKRNAKDRLKTPGCIVAL